MDHFLLTQLLPFLVIQTFKNQRSRNILMKILSILLYIQINMKKSVN